MLPRFPIDGFKPLQDPPLVELSQAKELLEFLGRVIPGVSTESCSCHFLLLTDGNEWTGWKCSRKESYTQNICY